MVRKTDKKLHEKIALERIGILFSLAHKESIAGNLDKANEFVELARKISMRTNTPIPRFDKRRMCKSCYHFLLPGVNSKNRVDSKYGRVVVTCNDCGSRMYYPIKK